MGKGIIRTQEELHPDRLCNGGGRAVCGWLTSPYDTATLAKQLGHTAIQRLIYALFFGDDLQKWCDQSVFGVTPAGDLRSTWILELPASRDKVLKQQQGSFSSAVKVIQ